jgi:hypothetical protein
MRTIVSLDGSAKKNEKLDGTSDALLVWLFETSFINWRSCFGIRFGLLFCCHRIHANFSDKICCHLLEARLVASKFFTIVLGGTAALHAYRAWGAVIF